MRKNQACYLIVDLPAFFEERPEMAHDRSATDKPPDGPGAEACVGQVPGSLYAVYRTLTET